MPFSGTEVFLKMATDADYVAIPGGSLDDDKILQGDDGLDDDAAVAKKLDEEILSPIPVLELEGYSQDKLIASIGYMCAMGVCGIVLVALGSTLASLAEKVGKTATEVGTVFITRGLGAILGAIFSAKLYRWFQGNHVMFVGLLCISILLTIMPFNTSNIALHILFLFLGVGTAVTDTGCQIMTRKLHGKKAGPWLGANTVSFGISGAFVPLIEIFTDSLYVQYFAMMIIVFAVALILGIGPNPEASGRLHSGPPPRPDGGKGKIPHYNVEIVIGIMVFFFIGGKVTTTAYLVTYVNDTSVIEKIHENYLVLVLWVAITIGRLAGVYDQRFLTNKTLPIHLSVFCVGGFLSMLLILWFPNNAESLWIGVAFYGLFNGPCVGYCYDLNNRITHPTEASMSIVMFGLNFGASLVPFATSLIWNEGGGPKTLIVMTFLSMFVPLPLLHITKYLSYDPQVNPILKYKYTALPSDGDGGDEQIMPEKA
jgi:predicted MFS family arabinose efflux permease